LPLVISPSPLIFHLQPENVLNLPRSGIGAEIIIFLARDIISAKTWTFWNAIVTQGIVSDRRYTCLVSILLSTHLIMHFSVFLSPHFVLSVSLSIILLVFLCPLLDDFCHSNAVSVGLPVEIWHL
jgi:hypothetical protein